ncbi:hypothetical protein I7I52_00816 [Histoplasma capsulatum]|uniref:Uncharacterized protein n=1 Tax=Ajellomyces capsulatus TaxID=5037 RepID=A0A8H7Z574_AJECA|nr:hypothetical protein I7I52_00816 [Histoplasma capsulatum]
MYSSTANLYSPFSTSICSSSTITALSTVANSSATSLTCSSSLPKGCGCVEMEVEDSGTWRRRSWLSRADRVLLWVLWDRLIDWEREWEWEWD